MLNPPYAKVNNNWLWIATPTYLYTLPAKTITLSMSGDETWVTYTNAARSRSTVKLSREYYAMIAEALSHAPATNRPVVESAKIEKAPEPTTPISLPYATYIQMRGSDDDILMVFTEKGATRFYASCIKTIKLTKGKTEIEYWNWGKYAKASFPEEMYLAIVKAYQNVQKSLPYDEKDI